MIYMKGSQTPSGNPCGNFPPCPGVTTPAVILKAEKALGTRLESWVTSLPRLNVRSVFRFI